MAEAIDLLGDRIAMAHAKDRAADGSFTTVGKGVVDFPDFVARLRAAGFDGPLVTHGLTAEEAPGGRGLSARADAPMRIGAASSATMRALRVVGQRRRACRWCSSTASAATRRRSRRISRTGRRYRRLTLECRAQGGSTAGSLRPFSIADVRRRRPGLRCDAARALCRRRHLDGAAIALRLAAHAAGPGHGPDPGAAGMAVRACAGQHAAVRRSRGCCCASCRLAAREARSQPRRRRDAGGRSARQSRLAAQFLRSPRSRPSPPTSWPTSPPTGPGVTAARGRRDRACRRW